MPTVIRWQPEVNIISFSAGNPEIRDIHWHKTHGGNIHVKMVFDDGTEVSGDVDERTPITKVQDLLDWMYRKGMQDRARR
jgi:hypothetical protein